MYGPPYKLLGVKEVKSDKVAIRKNGVGRRKKSKKELGTSSCLVDFAKVVARYGHNVDDLNLDAFIHFLYDIKNDIILKSYIKKL